MEHWKITKNALGPLHLLMDQSEIETILASLFTPFKAIPEPWYGNEEGSCVRYCLGNFGTIFLIWYDQKNKSVCISVDKTLALCAEVTLEQLPDLPVFTTKASTLVEALTCFTDSFYNGADWTNSTQYTFPELRISLWREMSFDPSETGDLSVQADEYDHLYFDFVRVYDPIYDSLLGLTDLWSTRYPMTSAPIPSIPHLTGSIGPLQLGMAPDQVQDTVQQFSSISEIAAIPRGRVLEATYTLPGGQLGAWYIEERAIGFSISQPLFSQSFPETAERFQFPLPGKPASTELQILCDHSLCVQNGDSFFFPSLSICLKGQEGFTAVGLIDPRWERLFCLLGLI